MRPLGWSSILILAIHCGAPRGIVLSLLKGKSVLPIFTDLNTKKCSQGEAAEAEEVEVAVIGETTGVDDELTLILHATVATGLSTGVLANQPMPKTCGMGGIELSRVGSLLITIFSFRGFMTGDDQEMACDITKR